ncbi:MAG: DNA polymerase III subunit chi [Acidimicrobiales bacterium]|jgi:DNA polymerase-3 subunit chi|nr:DNA polymerase III subunit chi [Acidimicrobiales bacterium]OUX38963.1 MAG: hypothetical protein CBE21_08300 [Proteobacteria bacterium TMED261]|tara:strand:- start:138 stop:569 length:432 start_codon:yes stop_codon:yes gene_type:complete
MTRTDFYLLEDENTDAAYRFACRLSLKAIESGTRVHIHLDDEDSVDTLDELMWHYPKGRFLAHDKIPNEAVVNSPVHLSCQEPIAEEGLLINLSKDIPFFFGRFDRVAEIIVKSQVSQGRDRYKHYRERGYPLQHHQLNRWED